MHWALLLNLIDVRHQYWTNIWSTGLLRILDLDSWIIKTGNCLWRASLGINCTSRFTGCASRRTAAESLRPDVVDRRQYRRLSATRHSCLVLCHSLRSPICKPLKTNDIYTGLVPVCSTACVTFSIHPGLQYHACSADFNTKCTFKMDQLNVTFLFHRQHLSALLSVYLGVVSMPFNQNVCWILTNEIHQIHCQN